MKSAKSSKSDVLLEPSSMQSRKTFPLQVSSVSSISVVESLLNRMTQAFREVSAPESSERDSELLNRRETEK